MSICIAFIHPSNNSRLLQPFFALLLLKWRNSNAMRLCLQFCCSNPFDLITISRYYCLLDGWRDKEMRQGKYLYQCIAPEINYEHIREVSLESWRGSFWSRGGEYFSKSLYFFSLLNLALTFFFLRCLERGRVNCLFSWKYLPRIKWQ